MKLSETTIKEIGWAIEKEFGKSLKGEELLEVANSLVEYFDLLARIHSRKQHADDQSKKQ